MLVTIQDAKTRLPELIEAVCKGETVCISHAGIPIAKLAPPDMPKRKIRLGLMKDDIVISDDFDAPLPEDVLNGFEGIAES